MASRRGGCVMEALRSLDEEARTKDGRAKYKKRLRFTEVTDRLTRKLRRSPSDRRLWTARLVQLIGRQIWERKF